MSNPHLAYRRNQARQVAHGTWQPGADLGNAANVGQMTVWEIATGARPVIKAETAQALLAITAADIQPQRVDANGSMWRLRSLMAMGHTTGRITAALGATGSITGPLIRGERATVEASLRDDINRLFGAWWDKRPPRRTPAEKTAACKALQRAAINNWPCPAAMDEDELDLPGYTPTARWRYAHGSGIADDDPLGNSHPNKPQPRHDDGRTARPIPQRGLYELHACLDPGHLDAARQRITGAPALPARSRASVNATKRTDEHEM